MSRGRNAGALIASKVSVIIWIAEARRARHREPLCQLPPAERLAEPGALPVFKPRGTDAKKPRGTDAKKPRTAIPPRGGHPPVLLEETYFPVALASARATSTFSMSQTSSKPLILYISYPAGHPERPLLTDPPKHPPCGRTARSRHRRSGVLLKREENDSVCVVARRPIKPAELP